MADEKGPFFKARILDPIIHMLLNSPSFLPLRAHTSGKIRITTMGFETWGYTSDASKSDVDHVRESEQTVPDEFSESAVSDRYKGARPDFHNDSSPHEHNNVEFDHDSDAEASTPSKSKEKLMKMAREYDNAPDKENQQSLSDLLREPPASSFKSTKRSTSPPLRQALAQRASILSIKKPSASCLRNEIQRSPADGDKLTQTKDKEPLANVNFQKQPRASEERATDKKVIGGRADDPKRKADQERVIKEKITQKGVERTRLVQGTLLKGSVADESSLIPPIVLLNEALADMKFRKSGSGLSVNEWEKVPIKFRRFHLLARFWELAYDPAVRKTVLNYKQKPALADEENEALDTANILLGALVSLHEEADIEEGVKDIDARNLNISEPQNLDPGYDTTIACETFAVSEGLKPDSKLIETPTDFHKELQTFLDSFSIAITPSQKPFMMTARLDGETLMRSGPEFRFATLAMEDLHLQDPATSKGKGEENNLPATNTTIKSRGKGKDRGKGKESDLLLESPATTDIAKSRDRDSLVKYLTITDDGVKEVHHTEASRRKADSNMLYKAKKVFLGPKADKFRQAMSTLIDAPPHDPRGPFQSPLTMEEAARLIAYQRLYEIVENRIRPQMIHPAMVGFFCEGFAEPGVFTALSVVIEELNWDW